MKFTKNIRRRSSFKLFCSCYGFITTFIALANTYMCANAERVLGHCSQSETMTYDVFANICNKTKTKYCWPV